MLQNKYLSRGMNFSVTHFSVFASKILRKCSTIIFFRIVAHLANSVACSVMYDVMCYKVSPYLRAAQFASIYDLIVISRYNHSAIARHLYSDAHVNN